MGCTRTGYPGLERNPAHNRHIWKARPTWRTRQSMFQGGSLHSHLLANCPGSRVRQHTFDTMKTQASFETCLEHTLNSPEQPAWADIALDRKLRTTLSRSCAEACRQGNRGMRNSTPLGDESHPTRRSCHRRCSSRLASADRIVQAGSRRFRTGLNPAPVYGSCTAHR
jgi:hypothetical protein